jgi:hypothetical protein
MKPGLTRLSFVYAETSTLRADVEGKDVQLDRHAFHGLLYRSSHDGKSSRSSSKRRILIRIVTVCRLGRVSATGHQQASTYRRAGGKQCRTGQGQHERRLDQLPDSLGTESASHWSSGCRRLESRHFVSSSASLRILCF